MCVVVQRRRLCKVHRVLCRTRSSHAFTRCTRGRNQKKKRKRPLSVFHTYGCDWRPYHSRARTRRASQFIKLLTFLTATHRVPSKRDLPKQSNYMEVDCPGREDTSPEDHIRKLIGVRVVPCQFPPSMVQILGSKVNMPGIIPRKNRMKNKHDAGIGQADAQMCFQSTLFFGSEQALWRGVLEPSNSGRTCKHAAIVLLQTQCVRS